MKFKGKDLKILHAIIILADNELHNQIGACPDQIEFVEGIKQQRRYLHRLMRRIDKAIQKPMKTIYISFGQGYAHQIAGVTFDANCVCAITAPSHSEATAVAFSVFGRLFCTSYSEKCLPCMSYFPRGIIPLDFTGASE